MDLRQQAYKVIWLPYKARLPKLGTKMVSLHIFVAGGHADTAVMHTADVSSHT